LDPLNSCIFVSDYSAIQLAAVTHVQSTDGRIRLNNFFRALLTVQMY